MGIVSSLGVSLFADTSELGEGFSTALNFAQDMVQEFVSVSSHLTDLSEKTGISTDDLQKLAYAGDLAGVSLNQIAGAATMLAKRIGTGEAKEGIEAMGLNFNYIKSLDMGAQFTTVASAMGQMTDQNATAVAGADAFGRSWATVLPLAKQDLVALGNELEQTGGLIDKNLVDTGDRAGDAWTRLTTIMSGWASSLTGGLISKGVSALEQDIKDIATITGWYQAMINQNLGALPTAAPRGRMPFGNTPGQGVNRPAQFSGDPMSWREIESISRELNKELKDGNRALEQRTRAFRQNTVAAREFNVAWKEGLTSLPGQQLPWAMPQVTPTLSDMIPLPGSIGGMMPQPTMPPLPPGFFERLADNAAAQSLVAGLSAGLFAADWTGFRTAIGTTSASAITAGINAIKPGLGATMQPVIGALGQGIASGDWSGFTSALASGLHSFATSAIVTGINLLIPGLGSLLSPLIGGLTGLIGGLFDRHQGRDSVVGFAESMGGFDALHQKLLQLGQDGERLWIALTQGVPSGNKDAAMAAIQQVINALNQQKVAGAAATDGLLSDLGMVPAAAAAAGASLDELKAKMSGGGSPGGAGAGLVEGDRYVPGQYSGDDFRGLPPWSGGGDGLVYHPEAGPVDPRFQTLTGSGSQPVINMTVNGTADKQFAALLARAIADGGSLRTQWQGAVA